MRSFSPAPMTDRRDRDLSPGGAPLHRQADRADDVAIENARLLNELRQRTDELSEALEQQTATSEVLKVISQSPGELEPVFQAMLQHSVAICEANFGQMFLRQDDGEPGGLVHGAPSKKPRRSGRG